MTAEPQKTEAQSDEDWEREQEEAEQALLNERVGLVVGGRYKIVRTLGAGGMGGVYVAEHELIGKTVALKCLHKEYTRDKDLVERFKREARAATAIGNEHIVDVTDMGDLPDGAPFLVMEFLSGTTLSGLMEDIGAMRIGRAVHIARQVCDALGAAHEKGIVHRDLKPENVFLTKRGNDPDFVKVLDFGISKIHSGDRPDRGLTRTGMAIGTPTYMSPEQAQGLRDVDARTDVWALGVIIYEMLTGHRPFEAESYPMLLMRIVGSEPDPASKYRKDIPPELNAAVMRCLEKPVATRMQTMRELSAALEKFAGMDTAPEVSSGEAGGAGPSRTAAGTMVVGSTKSDPAVGVAKTLHSSRPPAPNGESGVRASATRVGGGAASTPVSTPVVDPSTGQRLAAQGSAAQQTGEIGAVVRTEARRPAERTAEIGSIVRESAAGAEPTTTPTAVPPEPRSNGPMLAIGGAIVTLLAIGVGWMIFGGGNPPPSTTVTPPPTTVAIAPPTTVAVAPPPTTVVAAIPAEVRVRISVVPTDATITINDVEYPNPMDAMQPRQLTPVRISVTRDGYRTLERLAIFDSDQNFQLELSRGRGVQHIGVTGDEVPEDHGGSHPPPSSGHGGSFREEF